MPVRPHEVNARRSNIHHLRPIDEDYEELEDAMYNMLDGVFVVDEFGMPSYGPAMDNMIVWGQGSAQRIGKGFANETYTPIEEPDADPRLVAAEQVWFHARLEVMKEKHHAREAEIAENNFRQRRFASRMGNIREVQCPK